VPAPTRPDPYESEAYRLWALRDGLQHELPLPGPDPAK